MTSSKLSGRRRTAPTPPICKTLKPPAVPPVPPPGYPWPPIFCTFSAVYDINEWPPTEHQGWVNAEETDPWTYVGEEPDLPPKGRVTLTFDPNNYWVDIQLHVDYPGGMTTDAEITHVPVNWGEEESIHIQTGDWHTITENSEAECHVYI